MSIGETPEVGVGRGNRVKTRYAWLLPALVLAAGLAIAVLPGCRTSTSSSLPEHIKTVEVNVFQNKTMYKGQEGVLTRRIIDRINADPHIRVVSHDGDAVITGEIVSITQSTVRQTTDDRPASVSVNVVAEFSFYDAREGRYLIEDARIGSSEAYSTAGYYDADRGENVTMAEDSALTAMAGEIVRRTIGMW